MTLGLVWILVGVISQVSFGDPAPTCNLCVRLQRLPGDTCGRSDDCGSCKAGFKEPPTHIGDNGGKLKCVKETGIIIEPPTDDGVEKNPLATIIIGVAVAMLFVALGGLAFYTYKRKQAPRLTEARATYNSIPERRRSGVVDGNITNQDRDEGHILIGNGADNGRRPVEDDEILGASDQNGRGMPLRVEALSPVTRSVQVTNERRQESIPINRDEGNAHETFAQINDDSISSENSHNVTLTLPVNLPLPTAPPNTNSSISGISTVPSTSSIRSSIIAENGDRYSNATTALADDQQFSSSYSSRTSRSSDSGIDDKMDPPNKETLKIDETVENAKINVKVNFNLDILAG